MTYQVGEEMFRTKADINARAKSVINSVPLATPILAEQAAFVHALFVLHPDYYEKCAGREISHFEVRIKSAVDWVHKVFNVIFVDGARDDFSIAKALLAAKPVEEAA